jgi:hypothetical protein
MYLAPFHRFRQLRKKSHAYSNFNHSIEKSPNPNGILKWRSHLMPQACISLHGSSPMPISQLDESFFNRDKYLMRTYKASVRVKVNGRTQVIATEIRAPNVQDARWLLWAMYGFHSIQIGPILG